MKLLGLTFLLTIQLSVFGQDQEQSFKKIKQIFDNYIKQNESPDSENNKIEMQLALKTLQTNCDTKYFPTLIDVWMYYNPTDFPTREYVLPILVKNKSQGLKAIEKRIKGKKNWETDDTAPFSDLLALRDKLSKL